VRERLSVDAGLVPVTHHHCDGRAAAQGLALGKVGDVEQVKRTGWLLALGAWSGRRHRAENGGGDKGTKEGQQQSGNGDDQKDEQDDDHRGRRDDKRGRAARQIVLDLTRMRRCLLKLLPI